MNEMVCIRKTEEEARIDSDVRIAPMKERDLSIPDVDENTEIRKWAQWSPCNINLGTCGLIEVKEVPKDGTLLSLTLGEKHTSSGTGSEREHRDLEEAQICYSAAQLRGSDQPES